jgi:large subunit ribosomal protein L54
MPKLSTPTTASGEAAPPQAATPAAEPKSICPAGTVLSGLNYFKGKEDPVALPDEAYPEWLWKCLELPPKPEADTTATAEEFCTPVPCYLRLRSRYLL